jgi:Asp-tRNA(Asn)/Glu-tRNA(Gln) amidotransferase A subunit family amidase
MLILRLSKTTLAILLTASLITAHGRAETDSAEVTVDIVSQAEKIIGIEFTPAERDSMLDDLNDNLDGYRALREINPDNSVPPSLQFNPIPTGMTFDTVHRPLQMSPVTGLAVPENNEDLAFYLVRELAELVRTGQVTSMQLTRLALDRLKRYDPQLHCIITLTEELALKQAATADEEIASGLYRGPLHGIPYGTKDLLAVKGYKTTWGAMPYKDQVLDYDATVTKKLEEAGAVLVAKLTLGALAWGDVWYGDTTRNPWNPEQGSSGSSAGPASAVAAGLVPFAIGTETWGSIVSPSTRCGATGLRPTFGRVSRSGAMALSWSMDKIGPICRTVEDCALVFDAIRGPDGLDQTVVDLPFNYASEVDLKMLRIGYLKEDFDADTANSGHNNMVLQTMRELGAELIPISLPDISMDGLPIILVAEAAAAFDELTLSDRDDLMVRQIKNAWPNVFRSSRLIPAVEYIQANRVRTLLIQQMAELMSNIDVYLSPTFEGNNLLLTNLTGHPCVVLPDGFNEDGEPTSITFMGQLYDEATLLGVARAYQEATDHHKTHPPLFK